MLSAPPAALAAIAKPLWSTKTHAAAVEALTFSADRRILATAGSDGTGILWDFGASKPRSWSTFNKPGTGYRSLAFSPNRRTLAAGTAAGIVVLFDVVEGTARELRVLKGGPGALRGLAISPDGRLIAGGGDDPTLRVWEPGASTGGEARTTLPGHTKPIHDLTFSPNGLLVATVSADQTARVWSLGPIRPSLRTLLPNRAEVLGATFSPDGKTLATALQDGIVLLWDLTATKPTIIAELASQPGTGRLVHFCPDGETLVSCGGARVTIWGVRTRKPQAAWDLPTGTVTSLAVTADGRYLARGLADGGVEVFRVGEKRA